MPDAHYELVSRWQLPAPIETVYEIVSRPTEYPRWWGNVFLSACGDEAPAARGKRAEVVTRGILPYRLRWALTCVEAVAPTRLVSELSGDFEGSGVWSLLPTAIGTEATLDWRPDVRKRGVRELTPLLRPLFVANHRWAMRQGERAILRLLAGDGFPAGSALAERHETGSQAGAPVR